MYFIVIFLQLYIHKLFCDVLWCLLRPSALTEPIQVCSCFADSKTKPKIYMFNAILRCL